MFHLVIWGLNLFSYANVPKVATKSAGRKNRDRKRKAIGTITTPSKASLAASKAKKIFPFFAFIQFSVTKTPMPRFFKMGFLVSVVVLRGPSYKRAFGCVLSTVHWERWRSVLGFRSLRTLHRYRWMIFLMRSDSGLY